MARNAAGRRKLFAECERRHIGQGHSAGSNLGGGGGSYRCTMRPTSLAAESASRYRPLRGAWLARRRQRMSPTAQIRIESARTGPVLRWRARRAGGRPRAAGPGWTGRRQPRPAPIAAQSHRRWARMPARDSAHGWAAVRRPSRSGRSSGRDAGGYAGAPVFRIAIAGHRRVMAADDGGEVTVCVLQALPGAA